MMSTEEIEVTGIYEQVTDMTVGQIVDSMVEGIEFYHYKADNRLIINTNQKGITVCSNTATIGLDSLRVELDSGNIYSKKAEDPWWNRYVGKLVMVRDTVKDTWEPAIFKFYASNNRHFPFITSVQNFKYMRPLTAEEKASIITED